MHSTMFKGLIQLLCFGVASVVRVAEAAVDPANSHHAISEGIDSRTILFDIQPKNSSNASYLRRNTKSSTNEGILSSINTNQNETVSNRPKAIPRTLQEFQNEKQKKKRRMQNRRELAKEKIRQMIENPDQYSTGRAEKMNQEELDAFLNDIENQQQEQRDDEDDPQVIQRRSEIRWLRSGSRTSNLADPSVYWDKWAQAFRMLGVYLECQNPNSYWMYNNGGGGGNGKDKNDSGCKRWVLWAAYVNPNYQGYGINEYVVNWATDDDYYGGFAQYSSGGCQRNDNGQYMCYNQQTSRNKKNNKKVQEEPISRLDCHYLDTEWLLLGVYRENFYDYFEQITKHLWYYNSYEYKVASSGLELINDECEGVGVDKYGNYLYKAPKPIRGGGFIIGLYQDDACMIPSDENAADYGYGYGYGNSGDSTLELFNQIFEEFKYCTLCIDYPSYQDGYFNGDGYDDGDLINQCWKFYSHDTYECDATCIASADAQGTINAFIYGNRMYGEKWDGSGTGSTSRSSSYAFSSFSKNSLTFREHFFLNLFLVASAIIFALALHMFYHAEGDYLGKYFRGSDDTGVKSRLQSLLDKREKETNRGGKTKAMILNMLAIPSKSNSKQKKQPSPVVKVQSEHKRTNVILVGGSNKRLSQNELKHSTSSNIKPNKVPKVYVKSQAVTKVGSNLDYAPPKRKPMSDDATKTAIAILSKKRYNSSK